MTEIIHWSDDDIPVLGRGFEGPLVRRRLNLTELHGEREYIRHAFLVDVDGDGRAELITRTMNANRARAIRPDTGETVWVSPDIAPPPGESIQISDIAVGDLDEDGVPEVLLASYQGDVICLDVRDGSCKWHRRIPWLINNSLLAVRKITPGDGNNIALTVAHSADECYGGPRPRYNNMHDPSLLVLDHSGETSFLVENYARHNSQGHMTWLADIDGDGFCEIACVGEEELIWFDNDGARLFALPCPGEDGHPDDMRVFDWLSDRPGKEILYLNGTEGVRVASGAGEILQDVTLPRELASHLQSITPYVAADGRALLGCNIRAGRRGEESKLLRFDGDLSVRWGLEIGVDPIPAGLVDWDGDGVEEIYTGGMGRERRDVGPNRCSFQVLRDDGSPVCRQVWDGLPRCIPLAVGDITGAGDAEVLVSVGAHDGPEGRWSLPTGGEANLVVLGPAE